MALPTSREKTFVTGEPIEASFLNNVQDSIVTLNSEITVIEADIAAIESDITDLQDGKRGTRTRIISPAAGTFTNCSWSDANGRVDCSSAPWNCSIPLEVFEGERFLQVIVARFGTGSGSMTVTLRKTTTGGVRSDVAFTTTNNAPASWGNTTVGSLAETVSSGTQYWVYIDGTTSGYRFNNIRVTTDVP